MKDANDSSKVSITIFDKQDKPIKTFSKKEKLPADKLDFSNGMNQFAWDMNYPPAESSEGFILWNGGIGSARAAPGKYSARFKYGKDSVNVPFIIKSDPNYRTTEIEYDAQVSFLLEIRDKFSEVQKAIKNIRLLRAQINDFTSKLDSTTTKDIKKIADSVNKQMTTVEEALYQTKSKSGQDVLNFPIRLNDKLAGLYGVVSSGQIAPSKQALESFVEMGGQVDAQLKKLKNIMDTDIKNFNKMINDKQLPVIGVK